MSREIEVLKHQLDWFRRQIFGQKSERRIIDGGDGQMSLGQEINQDQVATPLSPTTRPVDMRRPTTKKPDTGEDSVPFFDDTRKPAEVIELTAPEAEGLAPEEFEVIGHKDSFRLAQRPGSYVVLNCRSDDDALEIVEPIKEHCFGATWTMNSDRTSSWIVLFGAMPQLASAAGHAYRLKGQLLKNEFYLAGPMQRLLLR